MQDHIEKNVSFEQQGKDPGFLVARGRFDGNSEERINNEKSHRNKLANAIFMSITHNGYATIRSVGAKAIANAVMAIATATERCLKKDTHLYWDVIVEKGNLGELRDSSHVKDVTAYTFRLQHFEEKNNG